MHAIILIFLIINKNIKPLQTPNIIRLMQQFRALSTKNWILFKRSKIASVLQILLPIIFALFIILVRKLATVQIFEQSQPLSNQLLTFKHYGNPIAALKSLGVVFPIAVKQCNGTYIAMAPPNDPMVTIFKDFALGLGYTVKLFNNDNQIDEVVRDADYENMQKICFGISFENSGSNYRYNLRFNATNLQTLTQAPPTTLRLTLDPKLNIRLYEKGLRSGFISTATLINNAILSKQLNSQTTMLVNKQGPIYQEDYTLDPIYGYLGNSTQFLFLLPLLIVYLRQTSSMLYQKQHKIRQSMSITGMKTWIYYLTWFLRFFIVYIFIHLIVSGIITAMLPRVPYYIPFIIFFFFDILLIVQSFFIQIFVSRAKIGIILALLFFILQYVINFIVSNNENVTRQIYSAVSIIPHVAFILAFKTMVYSQSIRTVATFNQVINNYTIITALISIILNIIFWGILTWYLDQVFPNEWGAKKHPCFCCVNSTTNRLKKSKGQPNIQQQGIGNSAMQINKPREANIQVESVQGKFKEMQLNNKCIWIRELNKYFKKDIHAVKDLNLSMYTDQIFVLLGHNGAGKTSTISMITGMIKPTSGLIQVLGDTELSKIRAKLGVCPQHDTLYSQLTVEEHLRLFATFRGLRSHELNQEVDKLIKDVNLQEKKVQYAKNLSGGQKRRLSVAMAFCGGAKVIILDEPTSGMDTSARRHIWQMLKNYKNDRIIILTTHFMDQADYLGDRIGIMAGGRLVALGSNVYLKNKYGIGYNLTFVKSNTQVPVEPIVSCIGKYIPNLSVLSNISSELVIQLPMDRVSAFPQMFDEIDQRKAELHYETYGISITTLQQVFLKVAEQKVQQTQITHPNQQLQSYQSYQNPNTQTSLQNLNLYTQPIAMPQTALNQPNLTPMYTQNPNAYQNIPQQGQLQQIAHHQNQLQPYPLPLSNNPQLLQEQNWVREDGCCQRFVSHFLATILKRLRVIRRDIKSFLFQLILPMAIILLALFLMRISFVKDFPAQELSFNTYTTETNPVYIPISSSPANTDLLDSMQNLMTANRNYLQVDKHIQQSDLQFDKNILYPKKLSLSTLKGGLYFEPPTTESGFTLLPFTSIMNTRSPTTSISLQTLAAQTYINKLLPGRRISITPVNKPLARTYRQLRTNNTISGFFGGIIFSIALAFKFASIVGFIVKERQDRCKHQQVVSGLNVGAYWLGNYLYDFVLYLLVAIFSVVMIQILKIEVFTKGDAFAATCLLFLFFGLANIPLTYLLGYIFTDYGNAQGGIYFFNFVTGSLITIIILVLRWLPDSTKVGRGLAWPLRIIPSFAFAEGLINLGSTTLLSINQNGGKDLAPFYIQIALAPIIFLIVFGALYATLMFVFEWLQNNERFMRYFTSQSNYMQTRQIQDSDVIQEQQKALAANPSDFQILTKNLRKVYVLDSQKKYKVAVDNLSFGVNKGEVFGLLGVNGAGKTTTFKMLAGEVVSTSGESYFSGMKISENLATIRKSLGYCPQFDALIEKLTVREQLQLFYDMKCLPKKYKQISISRKIKEMNLSEYENKLSGNLSGGNKRKLSAAIALIGNPSIVFLDEPSTGMDPKARRFMWKVISRISTERKHSTVILTTHSMEEAQALSSRLGIMVNGNFKCIGTPQHIKSKYGKGFEIEIKVKVVKKQEIDQVRTRFNIVGDRIQSSQIQQFLTLLQVDHNISKEISETGSGNYIWKQLQLNQSTSINPLLEYLIIHTRIERIQQVLKAQIGQIQILQHFQTYIRFKTGHSIPVGRLFSILEERKKDLGIMQYSIKQATVQQIFNRFAEEGGRVGMD